MQISDNNITVVADKNKAIVLEKINAIKERYAVTSVLHDLRNPLWGVRLAATMMLSAKCENGTVNELANDILISCNQMFLLLSNVNDLYEISLCDGTIEPVKIDLVGIMQACVVIQIPIARHKKINIHFYNSADPVIIETSILCLSRIIDNLLSNAIKFSELSKNINIRLNENENHVECSIEDEGPGFTEHDIEVLYEKFAKRSAKPTNGESSSGIGLTVVKRLSQQIGVELKLQTELGKGSKFTLIIPKVFNHPTQ